MTRREEPPATTGGREAHWVGDHTRYTRDVAPAIGSPGAPGAWERAQPGGAVALQGDGRADAAWSFLYGRDTRYGAAAADLEAVAEANRRMRGGAMGPVHGPMINAPVWTWEVPLYFWLGGIAAGSSFIAFACDLAGDGRSAAIARRLALAAVAPAPPLLIADLGRPARFLNMIRIFKPRSPMNLGAWSLLAFSGLAGSAVTADLLGRSRAARALGGAGAVVGGYLGSYGGVLLATTAVPVWARSRMLLGPIFVCTAAATGAAATRLTLVAAGLPASHPTRTAVGSVETGAAVAELLLAALNERQLRRAGCSLEHGTPGRLFQIAAWSMRLGLALRLLRPTSSRAHDLASLCFLGGGLAFRYAWVGAGRASAQDHEAVAQMARGRVTTGDELAGPPRGARMTSLRRRPLRGGGRRRLYSEIVRRVSLASERRLRR